MPPDTTGPLAFLGSDPWRAAPDRTPGAVPPADGDGAASPRLLGALVAQLVEAAGDVVLLPTAAAYERPERLVESARAFFAGLGAGTAVCAVLGRADAEDRGWAEMVAAAGLVYLADGSPLHLRSVLKDSTVFAALRAAWLEGATVVGSGAAGATLSDPMVDPRGGAFSVGLGLVRDCAVVTGYRGEPTAQLERTLALAPRGCAVIALPGSGAVLRGSDGTWRATPGRQDGADEDGPDVDRPDEDGAGPGGGVDRPAIFLDGVEAGLTALAGKPIG